MYSRAGYVSLSRLWRDFEKKFTPLTRQCALQCLEADPYSSDFMFGTALDLCEDAFLRAFDDFQISLVPLKGAVVDVNPVLPQSGARLLEKCSAFESCHINTFPDEAGPDGKYLKQMGSSAFRSAELAWLWPDHNGRDTGDGLKTIVFANVFHTLPILFERSSFIVARERPPWSFDLLEEAYVRHLLAETRGYSICLSEASAKRWFKVQTRNRVEAVLSGLLPKAPKGVFSETPSKGGLGGRAVRCAVHQLEKRGLRANSLRLRQCPVRRPVQQMVLFEAPIRACN